MTTRVRDIPSRDWDVSSPDGAYRAASAIAAEVVSLGTVLHGNKKSAIARVSAAHGLGGFLRKLFHGEPATVHLHLYSRLCAALEALNAQCEARIAHNKIILKRLGRDAASHGTPEARPEFGAASQN